MTDLTGPTNEPEECPNCASLDTTRVFVDDTYHDEILVVRICNECDLEYDVSYGDPQIVDHRQP